MQLVAAVSAGAAAAWLVTLLCLVMAMACCKLQVAVACHAKSQNETSENKLSACSRRHAPESGSESESKDIDGVGAGVEELSGGSR